MNATKRKAQLIISVTMITVLIVSCIALTVGYINKKDYSSDCNVITGDGGVKLNTGKVYDLPQNIQFSATSKTNEVTVRAVVKPDNATNKGIEWALNWIDETENAITDYIELQIDSEDSRICKIIAKQPFDKKIKLTAQSKANTAKRADCVLDYKQKVIDLRYEIRNKADGTVKNRLLENDLNYIEMEDDNYMNQYHFVPVFDLTVGTIFNGGEITYGTEVGISVPLFIAATQDTAEYCTEVLKQYISEEFGFVSAFLSNNLDITFGSELFTGLSGSDLVEWGSPGFEHIRRVFSEQYKNGIASHTIEITVRIDGVMFRKSYPIVLGNLEAVQKGVDSIEIPNNTIL